MAINTGCFARVNPKKEHEARVRIVSSNLHNELSPDSLYVFENDALWTVYFKNPKSPADLGLGGDNRRLG